MRPVTFSQTGVGTTSPIKVDYRQPNFKIGLGCVVSGAATYTLQHSFNGIDWFNNSDPSLVNATTSQDTNYAYPVDSVRVDQTVGAGTVTVTLLQGS